MRSEKCEAADRWRELKASNRRRSASAEFLFQASPVEDDFSGVAGDHGGEALFKVAVGVAVGDDGGDVEA